MLEAGTPTLDELIVEVWGEPVGLVEKDGDLFRFHALTAKFQGLQGMTFSAPGYARIAAARQARKADGCKADVGDKSENVLFHSFQLKGASVRLPGASGIGV